VVITNLIVFVNFFIALLLAFEYRGYFWLFLLVIVSALLYLLPLILNWLHYTRLSRWLICATPPVTIVMLSVLGKIAYPTGLNIMHYLDVRFFLTGSMVIPLLVIQTNEKKLLILALLVSGLLLVSLDLIFNFFGVGYYDLVKTETNYYFVANFYPITAYTFILICLLFEKSLSDKSSRDNELLIKSLHLANRDLEIQKKEIADQNNEITAQSEELIANQEQLIHANKLIGEQKEILLRIQSGLQTELLARNKELIHANKELVKYNNELQQFSYTISHNLRGPLARLLGLTNLMEKDLAELTGSQLDLVKLVSQSAREFDEVIRDLGKIIDIRNDIYRIREKVFFQEEWSTVLRGLSSYIQADMRIESHFRDVPFVYTVRPIVTSILYNLASNAIKYRSPLRPLHLKIQSAQENGMITLTVSDNGLGMNLDQFNRSIFGLYKRFHTHTEGKGLGLYLVKLQIESMGGTVEVTSEPNVGTTFKVYFKEPDEVEGQVVFESDFGSVFYNARTNCAGLIWKKQVMSSEYRELFSKSLEMVKLYHTPFWISDLSRQGTILPEDQVWMVTTILPEAVRQGLRKIANVYQEGQHNEDYRARIKDAVVKLGIEIEFFTERIKAEEWVERSFESANNPAQ
jgi:signal transduction histidine kinase